MATESPLSRVWTITRRPAGPATHPEWGDPEAVFSRVGIDGDGGVDEEVPTSVDLDDFGGHLVRLLVVGGAGVRLLCLTIRDWGTVVIADMHFAR